MSIQFENISLVAAIVGVISVSSSLIVAIRERIIQKSQSSALKEESFSLLLNSSDIASLGKYLDEDIGKLYISDYVDNTDLTRKVDLFINKLTQFVGTEEDIESQTDNQKAEYQESLNREDIIFSKDLPPEFGKIIYELYQGETWNALARLRRHIEIRLTEIAMQNGIEKYETMPLTLLLDTLRYMGVIELNHSNDLKTSIRLSNRAIHGQMIELQDAEKAIYIAAEVMKQLDKNTPNTT